MAFQHRVFLRWLLFAFRLWSFSCVCLWPSWLWASQQQKTRILPPVRDPEHSDVLFPPTSSGVRVLIIPSAMFRLTSTTSRIKTCMCLKFKPESICTRSCIEWRLFPNYRLTAQWFIGIVKVIWLENWNKKNKRLLS